VRRRIGTCAAIGVLILLLALLFAPHGRADAPPTLVPLAEVGPWPAVSRLIAYQNRIWFANSAKFRNHNSADLYSYDPTDGTTRYEAQLFSQDAGHPAVLDGLLYWPFEDARLSRGVGEFMVTDGAQWGWYSLPDVRAFHTHVILAVGDILYATTSAWKTSVLRSDDRGTSWRILYTHPTPDERVSRITALTTLGGSVYAGLRARHETGPKLLRETHEGFAPVPGWPYGTAVGPIAAWRGHVYAFNNGADGIATWRTDGKTVEPIGSLRNEMVRAIAPAQDALWLVTGDEGAGALWRSTDGINFEITHRFENAQPIDVLAVAGEPFVGTIGPGDGGTLWGPRPPAGAIQGTPIAGALPRVNAAIARSVHLGADLAALDAAIAEVAEPFERFGDALERLIAPRDPAAGQALSARLHAPLPPGTMTMFGGKIEIRRDDFARWYLIAAIAANGHGRIPPTLLAKPFDSKPNRAEKYLDAAVAAFWAVARLGQRDDETLAALIARLDWDDDPRWITGDVVGALTALTGERFGHDRAGWRAWWAARKAGS
jgi:hypothetical protein